MVLRALAASSMFATIGCSDDVSQLVVVVDGDLTVPAETDSVRIDIVSPKGEEHSATGALRGEDARPLPRVLTLVHRGGALGPVDVRAIALRDGRSILEQRAVVSFQRGKTLVLRLSLMRACVNRTCLDDETCDDGTCRPIEVDPSELEEWTGEVPHQDGAVADAGMSCSESEEICNHLDDDCDDDIDEDFDLDLDSRNCGGCGNVCSMSTPNVTAAACVEGRCEIECDSGFYDCDEQPTNGCESQLHEDNNCGACGEPCDVPNATASCATGVCVPRSCEEGYGNCDGNPENGCESALAEVANCGGCGIPCELAHAVESCAGRSCGVVSCETGFDDCDERPQNGCEISLLTDPLHCGGCGRGCPKQPPNASGECSDGHCVIVCDVGWADCDQNADNGCEENLASAETCGNCRTQCNELEVCAGNPSAGYTCLSTCSGTACGTSCVDTQTDPTHCGNCETMCTAPAHASPGCASGFCTFTCDPMFGDCDTGAANGCEASLLSLDHCGACGVPCARTGATPTCATGTCAISTCNPGRGNCDTVDANGCETMLNTSSDCGACNTPCARANANAMCDTGVCRITQCSSGYDDCDGVDGNGCEAALNSDEMNCGKCDKKCKAREQCVLGLCLRTRL